MTVRVPLAERAVEPNAVALRVPQAARVIGVSERQLWKYIAARAIPISHLERCTVVLVADLEAFVRDNAAKPATPVVVSHRRSRAATRRKRPVDK